jgi:hypothetical protein
MTTTSRPKTVELARYVDEFSAIRTAAHDMLSPIPDDGFRWRPAPDRWSVGQCIAHLVVTGNHALRTIDAMCSEARRTGSHGTGPFRHPRLGNLFVRINEPPYRMRVKTSPQFEPADAHDRAALIADFLSLQDVLIERAHGADGLNLSAPRSVLFGPFRLTLGQWFGFTASHERRHLWQARNVVEHPRFRHV